MSRKITFFFTILFTISLGGFAWAAGEGRRQIRPLDYQSLRSYTESQQVIQIMLLNDILIILKTKYVEMLPVMSHQSAVSNLIH